MATIIETKDDRLEHLIEYTEKILRYGGKLMQCIEELGEKSLCDEHKSADKHPDYTHRNRDRWSDEVYYSRYY